MTRVHGFCPMGCGATLFLGSGGRVTCSFVECPRPDAVDALLDDRETEHVVYLRRDGYDVRHPPRERLDNNLLTCDLHAHIATYAGPPGIPGRYRVTPGLPGQWHWQPLPEETG